MSMIAPLLFLWLLNQKGRDSAPQWPGPQHPPPSRLPKRAQTPSAPPSPPAPAPAPAADAAPPMPSAATPPAVPELEAAPQKRSAEQAARDLLVYAQKAIRNKQGALLGTKARPNPFVRDAQRDMGVNPDGIYGPATRSRGAKLLHKAFPARVAGADRPLYIP